MKFVGIRVIKADVERFNKQIGRKAFRLNDIEMFRDGQWGACIECPSLVHSLELMCIMDRLRKFDCTYFMSIHDDNIVIFFQ